MNVRYTTSEEDIHSETRTPQIIGGIYHINLELLRMEREWFASLLIPDATDNAEKPFFESSHTDFPDTTLRSRLSRTTENATISTGGKPRTPLFRDDQPEDAQKSGYAIMNGTSSTRSPGHSTFTYEGTLHILERYVGKNRDSRATEHVTTPLLGTHSTIVRRTPESQEDLLRRVMEAALHIRDNSASSASAFPKLPYQTVEKEEEEKRSKQWDYLPAISLNNIVWQWYVKLSRQIAEKEEEKRPRQLFDPSATSLGYIFIYVSTSKVVNNAWSKISSRRILMPDSNKYRIPIQIKFQPNELSDIPALQSFIGRLTHSKNLASEPKEGRNDNAPRTLSISHLFPSSGYIYSKVLQRNGTPHQTQVISDEHDFYHHTFQEYLAALSERRTGILDHHDFKPANILSNILDTTFCSNAWESYTPFLERNDTNERSTATRQIPSYAPQDALLRLLDLIESTSSESQLQDELPGESLSATQTILHLWEQTQAIASLTLPPFQTRQRIAAATSLPVILRSATCASHNAIVVGRPHSRDIRIEYCAAILRALDRVRGMDAPVLQNTTPRDEHSGTQQWWLLPEIAAPDEDSTSSEIHATSTESNTPDNPRTIIGDGGSHDDGPPLDVEIFEEDGLTTIDGFVIVDRRRAFITLKRELSDDDKELGRIVMLQYAYENSDMGVFYWHRRKTDMGNLKPRILGIYHDKNNDDHNTDAPTAPTGKLATAH